LIPATRVEADKLARSGLTEFLDRQIDLGQAEARDRQIEIPVEFFQLKVSILSVRSIGLPNARR
jgi:hypothetical protein